ncbi:MAG: DNA gyrase inhibitor YacG [Nitrospirae bacterium]|nr:DNA gyrase inhibitor YacG [Nitrospirota bacterium]
MNVKCPICKKKTEWEGNTFRPFCSERCKLFDLGRWAADEYKMDGEQISEESLEDDTLSSNYQIPNDK